MNTALCRIGVFYDGSFFTGAQQYFYIKEYGWLHPIPFHSLVEHFIRKQEQNFSGYKVVYASWHQGLFTSTQASNHHLKIERNRHTDLMHAGVEVKYVPMSQSQGEKGVDVSLAVDAMEVGMDGKIDVAVLVTGDGDFVPLVRTLMKHGIRIAAVYFEYEHKYKDKTYNAFINKRLLDACNYALNINSLENNREYQGLFRGLFRQPEKPESKEENLKLSF